MVYQQLYRTPDGFSDILLQSDGDRLTGLCFIGSPDAERFEKNPEIKNTRAFEETEEWLRIYFSGENPSFFPAYTVKNLTPFRREVIDVMCKIPYGETVTYGDIAKEFSLLHGRKMSAQAVGGAVGWNPLCLIVPCHRVIGANGKLTGYGGGMQNKIALLKLEGHDMRQFTV